jgi:hypothetical protein
MPKDSLGRRIPFTNDAVEIREYYGIRRLVDQQSLEFHAVLPGHARVTVKRSAVEASKSYDKTRR